MLVLDAKLIKQKFVLIDSRFQVFYIIKFENLLLWFGPYDTFCPTPECLLWHIFSKCHILHLLSDIDLFLISFNFIFKIWYFIIFVLALKENFWHFRSCVFKTFFIVRQQQVTQQAHVLFSCSEPPPCSEKSKAVRKLWNAIQDP